jgi:hypothetical protein
LKAPTKWRHTSVELMLHTVASAKLTGVTMKRRKSGKRDSGGKSRPPSRVAEPAPPSLGESVPRATGGRRALKAGAHAAVPSPKARPSRPRAQRYRKAAALLREWMADESGYDEEVGALLEEELKKDPIQFAEEF